MVEPGEVTGLPGFGEWGAGPPLVQADQVDRDGGEAVLQGHFGQASVAGMPHSAGGDRLVDGAFRAGTDGVLVPPGLAGLLRAGPRQGFVEFLGPQSELTSCPPGGGALGAYRA